VVGTWGSAGIKIYINGELKGTNSFTGSAPTYTSCEIIGASSYVGSFIDGLIDEVRIYNRALSDAEIKALYDATK
jgi:hypothetical protein